MLWPLSGTKKNHQLSDIEGNVLKIDRKIPFSSFFEGQSFRDGWSIDEEDKRSLALTEIDLNSIRLVHTLNKGETSITGEENLRRLKKSGYIRLDAMIHKILNRNGSHIPDSWKKEMDNGLPPTIYFDGTILRDSDGGRCVQFLYWLSDVKRWYSLNTWTGIDREATDLSAVIIP